MIDDLTIRLDIDPWRLSVCGLSITDPLTVAELHRAFGRPTSIIDGSTPAPLKHRNNQVHVYDRIGLTFIEHHYTRLVSNVTCWLNVDKPEFLFTPACRFPGQLVIGGCQMPIPATEVQLLRSLPQKPGHLIAGWWTMKASDGFHLSIWAKGRKLPSGRRSKVRDVLNIEISWPHDNWQKPFN